MIPVLVILGLVAIDQIVKYLCIVNLPMGVALIPGFIELYYLENRGAAFGIMEDKRIFLIVMPIIAICGLIFLYSKLEGNKGDNIIKVALILIISGATGNLVDRVLNGFVVDMFQFTFIKFPVFNVADIYVVIGTCMFIVATYLYYEE